MCTHRLLLSSLGGCLALLLVSSVAPAQTGVQVTVDGKRHLISKDVGNERWAITYNLDDQTATGNVFLPGGGEPAFVWCQAMPQTSGNVTLQCFGANKCVSAPCSGDAWHFISTVDLPCQFFFPPNTEGCGSGNVTCIGSPAECDLTGRHTVSACMDISGCGAYKTDDGTIFRCRNCYDCSQAVDDAFDHCESEP